MKHVIVLWCSLGAMACGGFLQGRGTSAQLNELQQNISRELLVLRKSHQDLHEKIYPVLDNVSALHSLAQNAHARRHQTKRMLLESRSSLLDVRVENERLKHETVQLRQALEARSEELSHQRERIEEVANQHKDMQKRTIEFSAKEEVYLRRVRELEAQIANSVPLPQKKQEAMAGSAAILLKNSEQPLRLRTRSGAAHLQPLNVV